MWFENLTGFREENPEQVRANISLGGQTLTSRPNGRTMRCGRLETPSLQEIRSQVGEFGDRNGHLEISEVVANVQNLHADTANSGALFQVASQFNLLEMVSPSVTPEDGIDIYEHDFTQGPACAISAGAGTIFRNYFVPVNDQIGQTAAEQIDCLADLGQALDNSHNRLWTMQNGYAMASKEGLHDINQRLMQLDTSDRDTLAGKLRIGIQWDTEVTLAGKGHTVSQAFCSALPVAYSRYSQDLWSDFAQLVLDASYEATIGAAVLNSTNTGNHCLFLTLLGGGAFGNRDDWIFAAIRRAVSRFMDFDLDVKIVSYGSFKPGVQQLINSI